MAVEVKKIDSDVTGLRVAREVSIGVLEAAPFFFEQEPNSYSDFGVQITKTPRTPINSRRSRRKGVTTDLDASGGYQIDLTADSMEQLIEGGFLAIKRRNQRNAEAVPDVSDLVDVVATGYTVFAGDGASYKVGDLIFAEGFDDAGNNGLKPVTGITVDVVEAAGLTIDASPAPGASIRVVGFQGVAGDLEITEGGGTALPTLDATIKNLTELNIIPGSFIFIGGDDVGAAGDAFDAAHNNGFARVFSVSAGAIQLDKTSGGVDGLTEMVTEAGGTKLIRIFTADMTRNEDAEGLFFQQLTYQLERTLGKPNPVAAPTEIQAEIVVGALLNEMTFNIPAADKVTVDLTFLATNGQSFDGPATLPSDEGPATKVGPSDAPVFNTSSDFSRIKMAIVPPTSGSGTLAAPEPLFAVVTELTFAFTNSATPNKGVAILGAFAITAAGFEASSQITAYFADVAAVAAVRNNSDVTIDAVMVTQWNGRSIGLAIDIPLVALGDGRLKVEKNESITLPLDAQDGEYIPFGHSAAFFEFWWLPAAADT